MVNQFFERFQQQKLLGGSKPSISICIPGQDIKNFEEWKCTTDREERENGLSINEKLLKEKQKKKS